jgi:hypothetical protein
MTSLSTQHPAYRYALQDWRLCRDAYYGERKIKERDGGQYYLPPTSGMMLDGMVPCSFPLRETHVPKLSKGYFAYRSYLLRACFPDFMSDGVESNIGLLWNNPPEIKLPASMEYLRERATPDGMSLNDFLMTMHEQVLSVGRCGVLGDMPQETRSAEPFYLTLYRAEDIINWDESQKTKKMNLVVLDESYDRRSSD